MMRFLLSFKAVELMRAGKHPVEACEISLKSVRQVSVKPIHMIFGGLFGLNREEYGTVV